MHRKKPLSDTLEMYLKTVYQVRDAHEVARVRDLASELHVSPGTVSSVLKTLERLRLIDHERYGNVSLTSSGGRVAECIVRRYETIRDMLVEVLGVDPETASVDACMMEHAVSPATVHRMQHALARVRGGTAGEDSSIPLHRDCSACEQSGLCQAAFDALGN